MRSKNMLVTVALSLIVSSAVVCEAEPVGTAWTYQGRLIDDNNPGEGVYDFQFKLFDAPYTGTQQGSTVDVDDLDVIDGYFTVELDFGSDVLDSDAYWLEIDVRPGGTVDPFTILSPRQEITPTPYAMQTRGIFVDDIPYIVDYPDTWTAKESDRQWYSVAMSADGTKQTAVVYNGQIYVSTDSGNTWTPKESYRWWYSVAMSADGTKQTVVAYAGQIYVSTDSGNTWTPKESNRYWRSVAMSADGTIQTAVGLQGQIYVSMDSGNTWTAKESIRDWYSVAMSADGTTQTAVGQNTWIYVSTDSGNTWTAKDSNRNWGSVAMSADGAIQTAVVVNGQIYVSANWGDSWTSSESNRAWYSVTMSADGTKQTAVVNNGQVYVSQDWGYTWTAEESNRQWYSVAISADGTKQTAVVDQGQIYVCSADMSYSYNVGIGTTSPLAGLHVSNPALANLKLTDQGDSHTAEIFTDGNLHIDGGGQNMWIDPMGGGNLLLMCNSNGNVGIGTTNPESELHIKSSDSGPSNCGIILEYPGSSTRCWIGYMDPAAPSTLSDFKIIKFVSETSLLSLFEIHDNGDTQLVPNQGNVGIGTTSPSEMLHINKQSGSLGVRVSSDAVSYQYMNFGAENGYSIGRSSDDKFFINRDEPIGTGVLRILTIQSDGNVGIGTNTPTEKLEVAGTIKGVNNSGTGVHGYSLNGNGVSGYTYSGNAIFGRDGSGSGLGYAGYFEGNVWVEATMSAATVVDRTPYPPDLETAYQAVMSMERLPDGLYDENNKEVQLDHTMLSDFVRSKDGNRDLSATVSCHNEVLKDLIRKQQELSKAHIYIEQLQKQNRLLEARLAKLEALIAPKAGS